MRISSAAVCAITLLLGFQLKAAGVEPVARILSVRADIRVLSPKRETRPARTYGALFEGDQLQLPRKSKIAIVFLKGGRHASIEPGDEARKFAVRKDALTPAEGVVYVDHDEELFEAMETTVGDMQELAPGGVTILRGPPPERRFDRMRPINESAILTANPTFEWPAVEGVVRYELELQDSNNRRLWALAAKVPRLKTPADKPLTPGLTYSWVVTAYVGEDAVTGPRGKFEVIDRESVANALALAESEDPVLLALAALDCEQFRLYGLAIDLYEKLAEADPEDAVFAAALSDLYERAGEAELAASARQSAEKLGFVFETESRARD